MYSATKSHWKKQVCPHCVNTYFNSKRALNSHLKKCHPHLFHGHVCERCLNVFRTPEKFEQHKTLCVVKDTNTRPVIFPSPGREVKWSSESDFKLNDVPTYLVADLECVLTKLDEKKKGAHTRYIHKHQPCAFVIVVMTKYKDAPFNRIYIEIGQDGETLMERFVDTLLSLSREVYAFMMRNTPMKPLTDKQNREYEKAETCYICHDPFHGKAKKKVRDHDHSTGEYLGPACNECNLKRQSRRFFLPLIFHNAKGYDMHPLLQEVSKKKYGCKFDGIPNSSEKLLSLTIIPPPGDAYSIRVIDSLQFMMGSLSSLVENQKKEMATMEEGFPKFCEAFDDMGYDRDTKAFLLKKNEFPYEWLDSYDKLLWSACGDHATEEPCGLCKAQSQHSAGIPPHLPPL